jgi:hypothetical protein
MAQKVVDHHQYAAQHNITELLESLVAELLKQPRPADPLQFLIDALSLSAADARQVCAGLCSRERH